MCITSSTCPKWSRRGRMTLAGNPRVTDSSSSRFDRPLRHRVHIVGRQLEVAGKWFGRPRCVRSLCACTVRADWPSLQLAGPCRVESSRSACRSLRRPLRHVPIAFRLRMSSVPPPSTGSPPRHSGPVSVCDVFVSSTPSFPSLLGCIPSYLPSSTTFSRLQSTSTPLDASCRFK